MTIKILGIKIHVTYLFAAMICLMLFIDRTGLAIPVIFAVSAHEIAHLAAMKFCGSAPTEIDLIPGSVRIVGPKNCERKKENFILICGPLCNVVLFIVFFILYSVFSLRSLGIWAAVELVVAVFNLLPAKGLDGGSLLYNFLSSVTSYSVANLCFLCVSVFLGTFLLAFGIIGGLLGYLNPSLLILGIYIIILSFTK